MKYTFPKNFIFSCATSAYQIEGGAYADGKGPSIWDMYSRIPGSIRDKTNGDIACDSYHKYKEDVQLLKNLGVHQYRFSLSWPRILPNGTLTSVNQAGVEYYNNLINELLANNIEPMVTLFHWDLPQSLMDHGGFLNPKSVDWFGEYARFCYSTFGDRVKKWITLNEMFNIANSGYGSSRNFVLAPGNFRSIHSCWTKYLAGHHTLLSHARAYHIYKNEFKAKQKGEVGIALCGIWSEPLTDSPEDIEAAKRCYDFTWGWFAHPIFHPEGNYPKRMRDTIRERSKAEGRITSRLPEFTPEEIKLLKGSADFLGLNYYFGCKIRNRLPEEYTPDKPIDMLEGGYKASFDPSWKQINPPKGWIYTYPEGLRRQLHQFRTEYGNPRVIITENGCMDTLNEGLNDISRIEYLRVHLAAVAQAIQEGCNVIGYTAWSLMDNFEWSEGYEIKFGLYRVDFNDPERKRTPKASALWYKKIVAEQAVDLNEKLINSKI